MKTLLGILILLAGFAAVLYICYWFGYLTLTLIDRIFNNDLVDIGEEYFVYVGFSVLFVLSLLVVLGRAIGGLI